MIYDKPRAELFAQDAPESEIKPFTAWLRGLGIAFDETNGYPEMESFNGLLQALNSYIKYLEQNGFAEWSADLEYPIGAGVRVGNVWYKAKQQNTNKPPSTSQSDWSIFLNAGDLSYADPLQNIDGQIQIKDATTTQKGVTRFANATEVVNKQNVNAVINPKNVADMFSAISLSSESVSLPNGMIIKFKRFYFDTNGATVNFATPFPSACIVCLIGSGEDVIPGGEILNVIPNSISRFGFRANASAASYYTYIAIGY